MRTVALAASLVILATSASAQDWNPSTTLPDPMVGMDRGEGSRTGDDYDGRFHADRDGTLPDGIGACGYQSIADLSDSIQRLLAANGQCDLYNTGRYQAFVRDVPASQQFAVNYVAWMAGAPLLDEAKAAALDAQYLGASATTTSPEQYPTPGSVTASSVEGVGACGFPAALPAQRQGQDILAKMGRCDEYTGPRG